MIKLFIFDLSINSTQAFYVSKVNWKIRSVFCFNPYQNLTGRKKFKIFILKKATTKNTIPPKILKVSCDTTAETLQNLFNECLITDSIPDNLKFADITPVFKKKDPLDKESCRPLSVLPSYINNFLSP